MSFIIRNLTTSEIELNDLGLTLAANSDLDLSGEPSNSISISEDLPNQILATNIIVLDPLDGITELSISESIKVIKLANEPQYRINGGTLNQLDDVEITNPNHTDVLTYNASSGKWEPQPQSGGGGSASTCFPFYRADGTLDTITVTNGFFPFYRADGTYDAIAMQTCN